MIRSSPTERTGGALLLACALLLCACTPEGPNVILLTLDGVQSDHVSLLGYERETTPNIDWLGRNGRTFDEVVVAGCSSKASLTSLLTGLDFPRHRLIRNGDTLSDEHTTLAEVFHDRGYATAGFTGSAMIAEEFNFDQGFERFEDFGGQVPRDQRDAEAVVDGVIDFVEDHRDGNLLGYGGEAPFFVYAHILEPHMPWHVGSPWLEPGRGKGAHGATKAGSASDPHEADDGGESFFGRGCVYVPSTEEFHSVSGETRERLVARYDGALHYADAQIGRLVDHLRRRGLLQNTVIGVSTDHGWDLMDRFSGGHAYDPFDEVARVFFVVYDGRGELPPRPGEIQARNFDEGATLLGLAGIPVPEGFDGLDLFESSDELPRYAFTACFDSASLRSHEHKLVHIDFDREKKDPDYIENGVYLYDLESDPGQRTDVKREQPGAFRKLLTAYRSYRKELAEVPWIPKSTLAEDELSPDTYERLKQLGYVE